MPLDLSNDFKIFDGTEAVTVTRAGTSEVQIVAAALSSRITTRDAIKSDGTYTAGDLKWNLPKGQTIVFDPAPGDFIQDARGNVWPVGIVDNATLKNRFLCWCKRADFNPRTAVELKIYKPISGRDDTGAAYTTPRQVGECLGHINEVAAAFAINEGRRRNSVTHQIFTADQFPEAAAGWWVVDCTGKTFNVIRVTGKGTLGQSMVFDCEEARTPKTDS